MNNLISIFMPVYNGGHFLSKTITSIIAQTYSVFELICADDASTDDSVAILKRFAAADRRIRVYQKPHGGSVPKAYNFALPYMKGNYIFYSSQDDLMSPDLLEKMHAKAVEYGADAVIPNMAYYYGEKSGNVKKIIPCDKNSVLSGKEAFILSLNWDIHGFALWNANLVRQVGFDELATNSDEYAVRKFFLNSKKVVFSDGTFYYGNTNPAAITKKISIKRFDWITTNQRLLGLLYQRQFEEDVIKKFMDVHLRDTIAVHTLLLKNFRQLAKDERKKAVEILKTAYKSIDHCCPV